MGFQSCPLVVAGNEKPWLPGAVEVAWDADARRVAVRQGETPETLEGDAPGPSFRRVVYTLGAVVSHVTDPRPAHDSAERPSSLVSVGERLSSLMLDWGMCYVSCIYQQRRFTMPEDCASSVI